MKTLEYGPWIYYLSGKENLLSNDKCGKWMFFPKTVEKAREVCLKAIELNVCYECKHSKEIAEDETGLVCFYVNGDDIENHRKIISFMIEYGLIQKTKTGRLYNISFKFDNQTIAGEYGSDYEGKIKLENFINLDTGEFK